MMKKFSDLGPGSRVYIYDPDRGLRVATVWGTNEDDGFVLTMDAGKLRIDDPETVMAPFKESEKGPSQIMYSDLARFEEDRPIIFEVLAKAMLDPGATLEEKSRWAEVWERQVPADLERIHENLEAWEKQEGSWRIGEEYSKLRVEEFGKLARGLVSNKKEED